MLFVASVFGGIVVGVYMAFCSCLAELRTVAYIIINVHVQLRFVRVWAVKLLQGLQHRLKEKSFTDFTILGPPVKVFSTKFGYAIYTFSL